MATDSSCYLHIGAPKTGSTLLQRACFENREILERTGLRYPDVSIRGYGHHDVAFLLGGGYPRWATPQADGLEDLIEKLRREVSSWPHSILISSENFYLFPNPQGVLDVLERSGAIDGRQLKIIVYVRRQDDAQESWYNQTIKAQGYTHELEESLETFRSLWDYALQLSRWADVFGDDAIEVRPYEREQYIGGTLLTDFCSIIGIDAGALHVERDRINTSLNADVLEFQRALNKLPLPIAEQRRFHHELMELSISARGSGLFADGSVLGSKKRQQILDDYAASNRSVAQRFLGRSVLFEDVSIVEGEPVIGSLTNERLAAILAWIQLKRS